MGLVVALFTLIVWTNKGPAMLQLTVFPVSTESSIVLSNREVHATITPHRISFLR